MHVCNTDMTKIEVIIELCLVI